MFYLKKNDENASRPGNCQLRKIVFCSTGQRLAGACRCNWLSSKASTWDLVPDICAVYAAPVALRAPALDILDSLVTETAETAETASPAWPGFEVRNRVRDMLKLELENSSVIILEENDP